LQPIDFSFFTKDIVIKELNWSITTATIDVIESAECPAGGWTCGLAITPSVYQITGYVAWEVPIGCDIPSNYHDGNYTVQFPIVDDQGKAVVTMLVCACPDKVGWDDAHAPSKCPFNCTTLKNSEDEGVTWRHRRLLHMVTEKYRFYYKFSLAKS
jgi:hypothetical protein